MLIVVQSLLYALFRFESDEREPSIHICAVVFRYFDGSDSAAVSEEVG